MKILTIINNLVGDHKTMDYCRGECILDKSSLNQSFGAGLEIIRIRTLREMKPDPKRKGYCYPFFINISLSSLFAILYSTFFLKFLLRIKNTDSLAEHFGIIGFGAEIFHTQYPDLSFLIAGF